MDNDLPEVKARLLLLADSSLKPHYLFHAQYQIKHGYILQDTVRRYLDQMEEMELLVKGKSQETENHKNIMSYRLVS